MALAPPTAEWCVFCGVEDIVSLLLRIQVIVTDTILLYIVTDTYILLRIQKCNIVLFCKYRTSASLQGGMIGNHRHDFRCAKINRCEKHGIMEKGKASAERLGAYTGVGGSKRNTVGEYIRIVIF